MLQDEKKYDNVHLQDSKAPNLTDIQKAKDMTKMFEFGGDADLTESSASSKTTNSDKSKANKNQPTDKINSK